MSDYPKNNPDSNFMTPERRHFELKRRAGDILRARIEEAWEEAGTENKTAEFTKILKERVGKFIPEATQEINTAFDALDTSDETNVDSILVEATEITTKLIAKYLTLDELEKRLKVRQTEFGQQELSRGLSFDVDIVNNKVNLHIPVTFFEDSKTAIESMLEGLGVLAKKLKTEDELKDINEIVGYSKLVREKRRLLTRHGFKVTLDENGKPTDEAKISKDNFLKEFGQ